MRLGRYVSVLAATALVAGTPAPAAEAPTTHAVSAGAPAVSVQRDASGTHVERTLPGRSALAYADSVTELRAALQAQVEQLSAARDEPASPDPVAASWRYLQAAGDLDRDGRDDFVAQRYGRAVAVEGVRGADGRRLWSRSLGRYDWASTVPLRNGGDGVLAVAARFRHAEGNTFTISTKIAAIAGDGEVRWEKDFDGRVTFSDDGYRLENIVYPLGVGRINGPGEDVALATLDFHGNGTRVGPVSVHGGVATAAVDVVDGRSGVAQRVALVPSPVTIPDVVLVDDLDGDALRDVVATSTLDDGMHVVAVSGNDGAPLWHRQMAVEWLWYAAGAGDTDGDGRTDLLLFSFGEHSWHGQVHLLSGSDGSVRWRRMAELAGGVRDIDGDGGTDVRTMTFVEGRREGFRYRAYNASGRLLYDRSHLVTPQRRAHSWSAFGGMWGDLDGDRRVDLAHELEVRGGKQVRRERGAVSSSDGRKLFDGPVRWPLHAALKGRGDDLATVKRTGRLLRVTTFHGHSGETLWVRKVRAGRVHEASLVAHDVTGDGRAELLVSANSSRGTRLWLIDAASQRLRWSRRLR